MTKDRHIITILAENKPGVLNKVASLCRRRRYNMESITAGVTNKPGISHITLVLSQIPEDKIKNTIKQLEKIIEIIKVELVLPNEVIDKELIILKLKNKDVVKKISVLTDQLHQADLKIIDQNNQNPVIQITGEGSEIIHILNKIDLKNNVVQMARSGLVALKN